MQKKLLTTVVKDDTGAVAKSALERVKASDININRIKAILKVNDKGSISDLPV